MRPSSGIVFGRDFTGFRRCCSLGDAFEALFSRR